ncbi:hypothetical protein FV219_01385 [Methylobacterium sp. WL122]|nr:hypothetical protein FV219_01385 [Methylobacterium sp. WL122]
MILVKTIALGLGLLVGGLTLACAPASAAPLGVSSSPAGEATVTLARYGRHHHSHRRFHARNHRHGHHHHHRGRRY